MTVIGKNLYATSFLMKFRELMDGQEHVELFGSETVLFLSVSQTLNYYLASLQRNFPADNVPFRVKPFVYRKLAEYGKELGKEITLTDYIIWGGFPKRIEYSSESGQRIYMNELNETIINIINRYKIRKTEVFKRLANFVFLSNSRILSARSVNKYMRGAGLPCSIITITKYIGYLNEASF